MNAKYTFQLVLWGMYTALIMVASVLLLAGDGKVVLREKPKTAANPLNGTYLIHGMKITLNNGRHEMEAAPGSATKIKTGIVSPIAYANLNEDDHEDAAFILIQDPGGSGVFYYVAAALRVNGLYSGTNAVLIGDRISPQALHIRNGLVTVRYNDRRPEESMSAPPTVAKSKYLFIEKNELKEIPSLMAGERIRAGWIVIGHEVRSFAPCPENREHWLLGGSPALKKIMDAYQGALPKPRPYTPLFMILAGWPADPPQVGFGAEYDVAFFATQLVRVWARGNCRSDKIYLESPLPGDSIESPLHIHGHARGTWFFEGDFPVFLLDSNHQIIATKFATAQKDWMTDEFVPFEGTITYEKQPSGGVGTLILKKSNPTGFPEHDDALEIPVSFD